MSDDIVGRLRALPPDLPDRPDRFDQVRGRVLGRRRRRSVVAAVAATVVLSVAIPLWTTSVDGGNLATGPLTCPQVHEGAAPWVPADPQGVDGRSRLVPPQTPQSALVCAYDGFNDGEQKGWALTDSRELSGGLDQLATDLTLRPRYSGGGGCTQMGGPQVDYLLGLSYPDGVVWVSTAQEPNNCVASSNGVFRTGNLGDQVAAAHAAGAWPLAPPPAVAPCADPLRGRLGQETTLVPDGVTSVDICPERGDDVTVKDGFDDLVAASTRCRPVPRRPRASAPRGIRWSTTCSSATPRGRASASGCNSAVTRASPATACRQLTPPASLPASRPCSTHPGSAVALPGAGAGAGAGAVRP